MVMTLTSNGLNPNLNFQGSLLPPLLLRYPLLSFILTVREGLSEGFPHHHLDAASPTGATNKFHLA